MGVLAVVVGDIQCFLLLLAHAFLQNPSALKHLARWELIHREVILHSGDHVVDAKCQTVRCKRKRHIQSFSVTDSLLQTGGKVFGGSLGFDHRYGIIRIDTQQIVGFLFRRTLILAAD